MVDFPPLTTHAVPLSHFQSCHYFNRLRLSEIPKINQVILITNFPFINPFSIDPHVTLYFIVDIKRGELK